MPQGDRQLPQKKYDLVKMMLETIKYIPHREGNPALAEAWATEKISEWLSNVLKFETKDADTLVNIARGNDEQFMFRRFKPR